jgi:hypothetical protein
MIAMTSAPLLRFALLADGAASGAVGALLALGSTMLAPLFGLAQPLVLGCGLFFLVYAAFVAWLGAQAQAPRWLILLVIVGNCVWAFESLASVALGWLAPTQGGLAFIIFQAAVVAALAGLQFVGLRRARLALA